MIEIDNFLLQNLIDKKSIDLIEVNQVAADNSARKSTNKLVVLTTLSSIFHHFLQFFFLFQFAYLQIDQVEFLHPFLITQSKKCLWLVQERLIIPLGRLVKLGFFNIVFIQILLNTFILYPISLLFPPLKLILLENTMELLCIQQRIFDPYLFLLLLPNPIVLVEKVIDSHIPPQVHCRQISLYIDFLCKSLQIMRTLFRIEERVVSINCLLFFEIGEDRLMWEGALHF